MMLSAIRPTETWSFGSIVGGLVILTVVAFVVWTIAKKSAE
jgi:hypothetical protein